jgi:DNA-binding MarR family transcriptional regulator
MTADERELPSRLPPSGSPNVLFQQFRTGVAIRELMQEAVAGTGVTGEEYGVLGVIAFFPGRTPTVLASTLGIPPTTVSRHVARFLADGLVERAPNPSDGRSYLLSPTDRGREIVETVAPRVGELVAALKRVSEVPLEEIATALAALETAAKRVQEDRRVDTTR